MSDAPGTGSSAFTRPRFAGLGADARRFFAELESERPAVIDRGLYVANVLSPLKALVVDIGIRLAGSRPAISLVPRVGDSLSPGDPAPVRRIRGWDAASSADASPLLFVDFRASGIDVGLEAGGADPAATARVRRALVMPGDSGLRSMCAALVAVGWRVDGERLPDGEDGSLPADLRPWLRHRELRVRRPLAWEDWQDEPGLAVEIADRFRELLPLLDAMRDPAPRRSAANVG